MRVDDERDYFVDSFTSRTVLSMSTRNFFSVQSRSSCVLVSTATKPKTIAGHRKIITAIFIMESIFINGRRMKMTQRKPEKMRKSVERNKIPIPIIAPIAPTAMPAMVRVNPKLSYSAILTQRKKCITNPGVRVSLLTLAEKSITIHQKPI